MNIAFRFSRGGGAICVHRVLMLCFIFSVVKEEIVDDDAHLPSCNGRVISWVRLGIFSYLPSCMIEVYVATS